MDEPEFIYNYNRFETADEALEAFHNLPNIGYKNGIKFLDWIVWKITKPKESDPRWHKTIWERTLPKYKKLRRLENRDALDMANATAKDVFDMWMKYEVLNPDTGNVIENKRWIVDWLWDPINDSLKYKIS